jgi:hypothetical protein
LRRALFVAAAVATAAAPGYVCGQSADASAARAHGPVDLTFFVGAGGTVSRSQPGLDRSAGPTFVAGVELARPGHLGLLGHLALRAEGGFASQGFASDQGAVDGDVQTVHAALALRADFARWGVGRVVPYALAGAVWGRPSTRFALNEVGQGTPGARFEQVTHENVPGAIVGGGIAWQMQRVALRAETRWMALATAERASSTLPVMVTIAVPLNK